MDKLTPKNIFNTIIVVKKALESIDDAIRVLKGDSDMEYPIKILSKHKESLKEKLEVFGNMDTEAIKKTIYDEDFESLIRPTLSDELHDDKNNVNV